MGAVWMCFPSQLRARLRTTVALGVLLGVTAGAATAAAVGARRTETAYPRFVERYRAYDVTVSTGGDPNTDEIFERIARLPLVRSTYRGSLFFASVRTASGAEVAFPDVFVMAGPVGGGRGYKIVAGRDLHPNAEDETLPNYAMAERLDLRPGDHITITLTPQGEEPIPPSEKIDITVVGIAAQVGSFESATGAGFTTTLHMSPAFGRRWSKYGSAGEDQLGLILRRGEADAGALERELQRQNIHTDGPPSRASSFTKGVQDLNRVPAIALWLLCGFLVLTTLVVFSQLLAREIQVTAGEHPVLRALGSSRRELTTLGLARACLIAAIGAIASVGIAILLSPLTPVGLARIAEPDPGFTVEPLLLAAGAGITLTLMLLVALGPAWRAARAASGASASSAERGSSLADALARMGAPASMHSGVRLATWPGRGDRVVPVRTAAMGMTIALTALAAALGFALSLSKLVDTPRLSGYAWDAGAIVNAFSPEEAETTLPRMEDSIRRAMPGAKQWRGTVFLGARVEKLDISALVSAGPPPSVITGRAPHGTGEVALDPRTLRQLRRKLGDTVRVANVIDAGKYGPAHRMTIVGTFVVPRLAFQSPEYPGQGVAFSPEAAKLLNPTSPPADTVFVRFPANADFDRELSTLRTATRETAFALVNRTQSATVGNVARISALPLLLAVIVGVLGAATLAHALITTIRRRRRDLAILKTLGFVRSQLRGTVAWQCTTLIVVALAIGVPGGIAAGRWGWRLFATQLAVVPLPAESAVAAVGIVVGTIVLGNLIALGPGLAAARTPAAEVLRTE